MTAFDFIANEFKEIFGDTQLPQLTGSEKQIRWAEDIRANVIDGSLLDDLGLEMYFHTDDPLIFVGMTEAELESFIVDHRILKMDMTRTRLAWACFHCTEAKYFIDNRYYL